MSEVSSSSESRSPVNGDLKRSQEIEVSLKTYNLGIHPNHEKEDVAMGNVEDGEVQVSEAGLENSMGKDPSAIVRGEWVIEETSLTSNPADRSLEEKRETCPPIKKASEEAHQSEQGEDEPFSSSDREENWSKAERVFFPEIVLEKSTKKRYGSLKQIQDKSISKKERKSRDRAICREKQFGKGEEKPEVSGRSLSESDLINHKKTLLKRAKRTLALGKCLGVDIEGNEEGVLNEIVRLESMN
ncbi:hypothetical protein V6N12_041984 [Hibiscus sabdariffa]|uniref:Uncharacterized protein n=1 Tax=Hibiscus sabdariffa TaxID=183260 RepID=A0ABR2EDG2_9ROSI